VFECARATCNLRKGVYYAGSQLRTHFFVTCVYTSVVLVMATPYVINSIVHLLCLQIHAVHRIRYGVAVINDILYAYIRNPIRWS